LASARYYHGLDGTEINKMEADKMFKLAAEAGLSGDFEKYTLKNINFFIIWKKQFNILLNLEFSNINMIMMMGVLSSVRFFCFFFVFFGSLRLIQI
jgi:hypothetical protein